MKQFNLKRSIIMAVLAVIMCVCAIFAFVSLSVSNVTTAQAAADHSGHSSTGSTPWTEINNGNSSDYTKLGVKNQAANYYLGTDVTTNITIEAGIVTLCLNGNILTGAAIADEDTIGSVITVESGATLILCDCGTTTHYYTVDDNGAYVFDGVTAATAGAKSITGGVITGGTGTYDYSESNGISYRGGGISSSGLVYMSGGTIAGNTVGSESGNTDGMGAGVYLTGGEFYMTGGSIEGNVALGSGGSGGGVRINGNGIFNLDGGAITNNTATSSGGGVNIQNGTLNMYNGYITNNTQSNGTAGGGGAVYIATNSSGEETKVGGTFNLSGGYICGNTTASSSSYDIYISNSSNNPYGGVFEMTGGYLDATVGLSNASDTTTTQIIVEVIESTEKITTIDTNHITISGGYLSSTTYNSISSNGSLLYIADGYIVVDISGENHYDDEEYEDGYPYAVYKDGTQLDDITMTYGDDYNDYITVNLPDRVAIESYTYTDGENTVNAFPINAGIYDVTPTFSITDSNGNIVSAYMVTVDGVKTFYYSETFNPGYDYSNAFKVTINKATLTVTADDITVTYGDDVPTYTIKYSGWVNGDSEDNYTLTTAPTATSDYTKGISVSESGMDITVSGGDDTNYEFKYVYGTLTINPATLTVTSITAQNRAYDGTTEVTLDVELSGVYSGDDVTASAIGKVETADVGENKTVTDIEITLTGSAASNYVLDSTYNDTVYVTIYKATLTIVSITAQNRTYDGTTDVELAIEYNYDGITASASGSVATADAGENKVVTDIEITLTGSAASNYVLDSTYTDTVYVTIYKATLTATADNITVTYGDDEPTYTITYSGWVDGDEGNYTLTTAPTATSDYTKGTSVSESGMDITVSGGDDTNYEFKYVYGTLTINPATLTVASITAQSRAYDGTTEVTLDVELSGVYSGDDVTASAIGKVEIADVGENKTVADIEITLIGDDTSNYVFDSTYTDTVYVTIYKATMTIVSITAQNRAYDGTTEVTLDVELSGVYSEDGITASAIGKVETADVGENKVVTDIEITLTGSAVANYVLDPTYNGTVYVTIYKATLTATADNITVNYGDDEPTYTITYSGWADGDEGNYKLTTAPTATSDYTKGMSVGSLTITVSGGEDTNYTFEYINGMLTITAAEVADDEGNVNEGYKVEVTLEYYTTVYDGTEKEPGVTVVVNGVTLTEDKDYIVSYSDNVNVGKATVEITLHGNYSGTLYETFTITKASVVVLPEVPDDWSGEIDEGEEIGTIDPPDGWEWKNPEEIPEADEDGKAIVEIVIEVDDDNYDWTGVEGYDEEDGTYTTEIEITVIPAEEGDGSGDETGDGSGDETGDGSGDEPGDGSGDETGDGSGDETGDGFDDETDSSSKLFIWLIILLAAIIICQLIVVAIQVHKRRAE